MSVRNKSNFKSTKDTRYADNAGTGAITAQHSRDTFSDVADSLLFSAARASVDVTASPIVLNCLGMERATFKGSDVITGNKTISITNVDELTEIPYFRFEINEGVALTWPANTYHRFLDGEWVANVWTAPLVGIYEGRITYDGTNFFIRIEPVFINT